MTKHSFEVWINHRYYFGLIDNDPFCSIQAETAEDAAEQAVRMFVAEGAHKVDFVEPFIARVHNVFTKDRVRQFNVKGWVNLLTQEVLDPVESEAEAVDG